VEVYFFNESAGAVCDFEMKFMCYCLTCFN